MPYWPKLQIFRIKTKAHIKLSSKISKMFVGKIKIALPVVFGHIGFARLIACHSSGTIFSGS